MFFNDDEYEGVETSVVDQWAAPDTSDELASDIPENKRQKRDGLEEAEDAAQSLLEADTITQWDAEYTVDSETEAAVEDGATSCVPPTTVGEETHPVDQEAAESYEPGVKSSVVNQWGSPNMNDNLRSDIPETKSQTIHGLEEATDATASILEGDSLNQWEAEYTAYSETEAAVADGKTKPHPAKTVGEEETGDEE